mgnify:CR=1 FL=1
MTTVNWNIVNFPEITTGEVSDFMENVDHEPDSLNCEFIIWSKTANLLIDEILNGVKINIKLIDPSDDDEIDECLSNERNKLLEEWGYNSIQLTGDEIKEITYNVRNNFSRINAW